MSRWLKHFSKLRETADKITTEDLSSHEGLSVQNDSLLMDQPSKTNLEQTIARKTKVAQSVDADILARETLEQALTRGLEVTLADLELCSGGWLYRGQPVLVYGVDVVKCEDSALRSEFFHRLHLSDCCGALENPKQRVWIASQQETIELPGQESALVPCEYCLAQVDYSGFRQLSALERKALSQGFDFKRHLSRHSDRFFPVTEPSLWRAGSPLTTLEMAEPGSVGACDFCQWPQPSLAGWALSMRQSQELVGRDHCCLLCAQHQAQALVIAPEHDLLQACEARYGYWLADIEREASELDGNIQEVSEPVLAWDQVALHLPLSWQKVLTPLQQLDTPKLYYRFAGYDGVAVMAWPEHRRGIIGRDQDRGQLPEGWQFWTLAEVLESL